MALEWMKGIGKLCSKFGLEASMTRSPETDAIQRVQFNCPHELAAEEKASIERCIPKGIELAYQVHPKWSTIGNMQNLLMQAGIVIDHDEDHKPTGIDYYPDQRQLELRVHKMEVNITSSEFVGGQIQGVFLPPEHEIWDVLSRIAKADGALDSWKIVCEAEGFDITRDITDLPEPERNIPVEDEDEDEEAAALAKDIETHANDPTPASEPQPPSVDKVLEHLEKKGKDMAKQEKARQAVKNVKIEQPKRDKAVGAEDVTDLKISLETAQDVNDFIKSLEPKKED